MPHLCIILLGLVARVRGPVLKLEDREPAPPPNRHLHGLGHLSQGRRVRAAGRATASPSSPPPIASLIAQVKLSAAHEVRLRLEERRGRGWAGRVGRRELISGNEAGEETTQIRDLWMASACPISMMRG